MRTAQYVLMVSDCMSHLFRFLNYLLWIILFPSLGIWSWSINSCRSILWGLQNMMEESLREEAMQIHTWTVQQKWLHVSPMQLNLRFLTLCYYVNQRACKKTKTYPMLLVLIFDSYQSRPFLVQLQIMYSVDALLQLIRPITSVMLKCFILEDCIKMI